MSIGPALELRGVSHRYSAGAASVLRGISLRIEPGVSMALMGPSGSGKTTLLSILGLLLAPTEGEILLDGRELPRRGGQLTRLRSSVFGWVFQTVNVLPRRTAIDNAGLGLLVRGASVEDARRAAASALDAVGVGGLAEQPISTLSGGELQRVCIARAIAARPRFILADEPTGQLDRANTEGVIEALVNNRPPETSVVIATHDPVVAAHCDLVVQLLDGAAVVGANA